MATQGDNSMVRVQQEKFYDDGEQQKVEAFGRADERFGGTSGGANAVPRIQSYGRSDYPPKGSHAMIMNMEGNPDMASVIGMEHHEHRPKNLKEGEVKDYTMFGGSSGAVTRAGEDQHNCHRKKDEWVWTIGDSKVHFKADGTVEITCKTVKITASGEVTVKGNPIHLNPS